MIFIKRLNTYGISNWIIFLLFLLSIFSVFAQMVGLGIFLPIFEYIFQNGISNNQNLILRYVNFLISLMNIETTLGSLLIVAFLFYIISQVFLYIIAYANSYFLGHMTRNIRDRFFKYYLDADSKYYDQVKIGDFINISTIELGSAVVGVIAPIRLMVSLVSAIGSIVVLFMLSYELTFYIILIIIVVLPYPISLISKTTEAGIKNTRFNSILVSFLLDKLRSPRLVRLSGTRDSEVKEYCSITEKQRYLTLKIHLLKEKIGLVFEPAIIFSSLVILYVAITYLNVSPNTILLFMIITVRLVPIVRSILVQKQSINRSKGPINSIDKLLEEMKEKENVVKCKHDSIVDIESIRNIQLKNISYRYSGAESYTLSNISFTFAKNTLNAIIGPSGSGKSTLIDVISGYREPDKGKVILENTQSSELKTNILTSYVPQQPQMFDGSIVNHISYGVTNNSLSSVIDAAKLSGAHEFISKMDDKYQTMLSNNGDNLSGGQKYKIDMARALLSNKPILILDEPTSALDYDSKNSFVESIKRIKANTSKIIIVITHDFSIMPIFDSIVLLKNGKVISQSSAIELLASNSWYAKGLNSLNQ